MKATISYFVGVDISAETFACSIFCTPDAPVHTRDGFVNTPSGFEALDEWLVAQGATPQNSVICLEATGVYGEEICHWLAAKGYRLAAEPPLKVKRAFKPKSHKNDKVDSRQIAEYAYRYLDRLKFWQPRAELVEQIAVLLTTREQFVQQKTASINARKALKRKVVQTPLANQLYDDNIERLKQNIRAIEQEIKQLISKDPDFKQMVAWLSSTPAVGLLLAANMLVVTNGFAQREQISYRKLAAHFGICPYQHQSGKSVNRRAVAHFHGPRRIRKLLHLAARTLRTYNPEFQAYYLRKYTQGKEPKLILNNIANKLLKIMCATIRTQKPYIQNYRSINPAWLKTP